MPVIRLDGESFGGRVHTPQFFELVKRPDLGAEDVNDNVTGVNEHPIAMGQAFHAAASESPVFESSDQVIGYCGNVSVGASAGDHHIVGKGCLARKIYERNVLSFVVLKTITHHPDHIGLAVSGRRFETQVLPPGLCYARRRCGTPLSMTTL